MDLELKHLRHLKAIAAARSVNRAAEQLGIPQPSLSRELRRIEDLLGGTLFDRDHNGVKVTEFGRPILDYAEDILDACVGIGASLDHASSERGHVLKVGWMASVLFPFLLDALTALGITENVDVRVAEDTAQLVDWLNTGELDLAVHVDQGGEPMHLGDGVVRTDLVEDPVLLMIGADNALAHKPEISFGELRDQRWIAPPTQDGGTEWFLNLCRRHHFSPKVGHRMPVTGPREALVRHQGDVTLVQALRPLVPGVVSRPVADLGVRTRHFLLHRADSAIAGRAGVLGQLIIDAYWAEARRRPGHQLWLPGQRSGHTIDAVGNVAEMYARDPG